MSGYQLPPGQQPQQQQQPQPYESGLEVVPPSEPEWVTGGAQDLAGKIPVAAEDVKKDDAEKAHPFAGEANQPDEATPRPWWKRKRILFVVGAVAIIAIALGVGLGVGLNSGSSGDGDDSQDGNNDGSSNGDSDNSESDEPPDCKDTLCPRILSLSTYESALFVFGRTSDDTIATINRNGSSWSDWEDLGETTGNLISQPASMSWDVNGEFPRIDMVSISTSERTVYGRWHSEVEGWASPDGREWHSLTSGAGSAVSMCRPYADRLDMWVRDQETGNITHSYWSQTPDEDLSEAAEGGDTYENGAFFEWTWQPLSPSRSAPAVVCRDSSVYHDVVWYADEDNSLYHAAFSDDDNWVVSSPWDGDWMGDPALYAPPDDPERWEFFGVQSNNEMYHMTWTGGTNGGYSSLNNLGGDIISMPSIVFLDDGVFDILALGTNGTLQHRHYDGSGWSTEWEDLGVRAHSAPNMALLDDQVCVVAASQDGKLKALTRDNSAAESWKDSLEEEDLGGNLTLDFLTDDS